MRRSLAWACCFAVAAAAYAEQPEVRIDTERAARQIAALEGTYAISFDSGTVDGATYIATDKLTLARASETTVHFSVQLNFYNGHSCKAEGVAEYQPNGEFVYRERFAKLECILEIVPTAKTIQLRDSTGNCKLTTCDMRGSYNHASFARSLRQPPAKAPSGTVSQR